MIIYDETEGPAPVRTELPPASLWGAGFRQNNDVYNLMDYVTQPTFEADRAFDFKARAAKSQLYAQLPENFLNAQSDAEFDFIERRVAQELKDRNTLAAGGLAGIGVGIVTGLLSPTILLPGGAAVRGAGALRTGVSVASWAVVGVGLQEAVLQANQEVRTAGESAASIGAAAVLGGILGAGIGYLTKDAAAKLASDMVDGTMPGAIQYAHPSPIPDEVSDEFLGSTVGAKQLAPSEIPGVFGESAGGMAPAFGVEKAMTFISPVMRNFASEAPGVRQLQAQISSGGVALEGNRYGIAGAAAGAIEDRIGQWKGQLAAALWESKQGFKNRADRSMAKTEFNAEVSRAIDSGVPHSDPAINADAEQWKKFYRRFHNEAKAVGIPGFDQISEEYAEKYLNRNIRKEFSRQNVNDLLSILQQNSLEKLNDSLQKRIEKAVSAQMSAKAKADILETPVTELPALRAEFEAEMKMLPQQFPGEVGTIAQDIRAMRAEARGLPKDEAKALREQANAMEKANEALLQPFRIAEEKVRGKFRLLDNTYTALTEKQEKRLAAIDKLEEMQLASLESVARQGQKLLNKLDRADADWRGSAEAFEARVERSLTALEKAEARQAKLYPPQKTASLAAKVNTPTAWDLTIISDLEKGISRLQNVIGDKGPNELVRDTLGDSRPEKVSQMRARLEKKQADLQEFKKQFDAPVAAKSIDLADASDFEATVQARRVEFAENLAAMDAAQTADEMRAAVQQTLDDLLSRVNGLNNKRAIRLQKLRDEAALFDPAIVKKRIAELRAKEASAVPEVLAKANEAGAKIVDGKADFTELARQHAEITYSHLVGNDHRAPGYSLIMERGPELARTLEIDPERMWDMGDGRMRSYSEFLERDIEKLATRYYKTMAADIEIYRKFGTMNLLGVDAKSNKKTPIMEQIFKEFRKLEAEAQALPVGRKRERRLKVIADQERQFIVDTGVQLDRLRHIRGIPDDPNGFFYRAGRAASNLNVLRLLGRMALASVPDLARPIMKVGLLRAFRYNFQLMVDGFKGFSMTADQLRGAGVGTDLVLHSRATAMLDVMNDIESGTKLERGLQHMTNRMGFITGMDLWNVKLQQFAGAMLNMRMMESLDAIAKGKAKRADIEFLASNNIDSWSAKLILDAMSAPGGSTRLSNGVVLPNAESWPMTPKGIAARDVYRAAIYKAVNDTIVMPGVERPNIVDQDMVWKLIFQFRSFTLSSTTKVLVANAQQLRSGDMAPVIGSIFSLALGAFSYYTWATLRGGADKEKMQAASLETWADEAIRRSGLLAVFGEVVRVADEVPGIRERINFDGAAGSDGFGRKPLVEALGPTIGLLDEAGKVGLNAANDPERSVNALRNLMPLQNHFIASFAFDAVEEYMKGAVR